MGKFSGDYTVDGGQVFDESRGIASLLQQQKSPIVDVLLNTALHAQMIAVRRLIQSTFRNGTPFGAFSIDAKDTPIASDFKLCGDIDAASWTSSGLTDAVDTENDDSNPLTEIPTGPARFFVGGMVALLPNSRSWTSAQPLGEPAIHSTVTGVTSDTIIDSSAFFGELGDALTTTYNSKSIKVVPNINDTSVTYPKMYDILSYTATSLTLDITQYYTYNTATDTLSAATAETSGFVLTDLTEIGKHFRLFIPQDTSDRADSIYLDVYYDEMDATDDGIVKRPIGGVPVESANFGVVRQRLEWIPGYNGGVASPTVASTAGVHNIYETRVDGDGNTHHRVLLAVINSQSGSGNIDNADITQYNNNPLWGLTLGGLPPVDTSPSTAQIDGTSGVNSVGVDQGPGEFGNTGSVLNIPDLMLQSLGNVTEAMNQAMQNMGDYTEAGAAVAGVPGTGVTARTAITDPGHILLGTNGEQAGLINRYLPDVVGEANLYLTANSHKGLPMDSGTGSASAGQLASHAIQAAFSVLGANPPARYIDVGIVVDSGGEYSSSVGVVAGSANVVSNPPAPIILSTVEIGVSAVNDASTQSFWVNMGIDCSGYTNIDDLLADYVIQPSVSSRCSTRTGHFNIDTSGGGTYGLGLRSDDNILCVNVNINPGGNELEDIHGTVSVIGIAKGS